MIKFYTTVCTLLFAFLSYAQQTPAQAQNQEIIIVGATAHIGNGKVIENAVIAFKDGKITQVGTASEVNLNSTTAKIINAEGKHVYPGIIAPNSTLGLVEIDAVKASDDEDEVGGFLPHIRSIIAYNAESKIVESMRPNGVLLAQVTPRGGRISGTSSIVQLDAWNWEDAILKENDGIHLNWPNRFVKKGAWYDPKVGYKADEKYDEKVEEIKSFFKQAEAFSKTDASPLNIPLQAMKAVFSGEKTVFIHVDAEKDILDVLHFKAELKLENVVIVGGKYAHKVAAELVAHKVPVLVARVHDTPEADDDDYDLPYKLPKLLHDAGVLVGLENSGKMERMNARNIPFYAGTVAAQGLDKEIALQLITLNTAKILGIESQVGSLEVGKQATLFISEGDALDMMGNILTHAFIDGREVSLQTHQTKLYERYKEKFEAQKD